VKLPSAADVAKLVSELVGRGVSARAMPGTRPTKEGIACVLVDDHGTAVAATFSDRAFAAYVGAALALVPRNVAEDALRKGALPANLLENHAEVVNVATALFNGINPVHLRLGGGHVQPGTLPAALASLLAKPTTRLDMDVTVDGYGTGRLLLVA
jgi:hypothetical protein